MSNENSGWFNSVRFGMFVHWGSYSVAGRGEWIMNRERIPKAEYIEKYVNNWHAEQYQPEKWCQLAKDAGMGYIVLTTRHHDGFSLWNTKTDDFNAVKIGPRQDLLRPFVDAARAADLKIGFYYSPASWTHPDYPGAFYRDWPNTNDWVDENSRKRFIRYYQEQLHELLTFYGKINYLWFDGCIPENLDGVETLKMVKNIQPDILVNNRLGEPFDIQCCEQAITPAPPGQAWEACMTLNDNWGYHAGDNNWKQPIDIINMLLTCAENGGNLLLNVGPLANGTIPEESINILSKVGKWIKNNQTAISNSERHPFSWNCTARPITVIGNKVYLHFMKDPKGEFCWSEAKNKIISAKLLIDQRPIAFHQEGERLFLQNIPSPLPDDLCTTIELTLDGAPEAITEQTSFWIPG